MEPARRSLAPNLGSASGIVRHWFLADPQPVLVLSRNAGTRKVRDPAKLKLS
jgi:hypothetical protein